MKLTDRVVGALTCPPGRKDVLFFDDALRGFGVRVAASGSRNFLMQYRSGTKVRRIPLGVFGSEITTAQARGKAERIRGEVRDGRDPVAERKQTKLRADRVPTRGVGAELLGGLDRRVRLR